MGNELDRLSRAVAFCQPQKTMKLKARFFGGTVDLDEYGFLKIEGYLFDTRRAAQGEILGRLKRSQRHLTLTLGEFAGEIEFSNKQKWRGFPVEITNYAGFKKKNR